MFGFFRRGAWEVVWRDGVGAVKSGKVSRGFVVEAGEVLEKEGIREAKLRGVWKAGRVELEFVRGIPVGCEQRLRNIWGIQGGN